MLCPPSKKYKINDITDIDRMTPEGKMLFMALIRLSVTVDSTKTPAQIIEVLNEKAEDLGFELYIRDNEIND